MKKKTILHCLASPFFGGGEKYVYDLTDNLLRDGNSVVVYSPKSKELTDNFNHFSSNSSFSFVQRKPLFFVALVQLLTLVRKNKVDIVHIHNTKSLFLLAVVKSLSNRRFRLVLTIHLVKKSKRNWIRNWASRKVDHFVFVSQLAAGAYLENNNLIPKEKIHVIHNSIMANPSEETQNVVTDRICFVGRLAPEKGVDVLLEALALVKHHCTLVVVGGGNGDYVNYLKQKTSQLNLLSRVDFVGFQNDIAPYISSSMFGVLPSVVPESFGLTNLEFMRLGKAQIATNNGAQKEYLQEGKTALLVQPNEVRNLAVKIDYLLENQEVCLEMGRQSKLNFEKNLSYDHFYSKIVSVYEN
ncbi:MAG: glycosyltransferase family 4 protein [Bacteroidales bacterium]|nr:glycosyltransferase family 4 protein [Bacteroidales bacterium]